MNPPPDTLAPPSPQARSGSASIDRNVVLHMETPAEGFLVEAPIDYEAGIAVLESAPVIQERDDPIGGPFGA